MSMCCCSKRCTSMPAARRPSRWPSAEPLPPGPAEASVFDFEGHARMHLEPFEKLVVQRRRRRPESAFDVVADIARQAYRGLTDHLRRGTIAWIAVASDPGPEPASFRGAALDDDVEKAGFALLG